MGTFQSLRTPVSYGLTLLKSSREENPREEVYLEWRYVGLDLPRSDMLYRVAIKYATKLQNFSEANLNSEYFTMIIMLKKSIRLTKGHIVQQLKNTCSFKDCSIS